MASENVITMKKNKPPFVEELDTINRTYLFFNERKKLEDYTGISFSNHNTAIKSSFEKRYMAFEKLSRRAKEICNIDLDTLLKIYAQTSELITSEGLKINHANNSKIYEIIDDFIADEEIADLSLNAAVMVLILSGRLPKISTHKGNVENLGNDFESFFTLIDDYCQATGKPRLSYIDIHREQIQQNGIEYLSRMELIMAAVDILLVLRNYHNHKSRYATLDKFKNTIYNIDGVYCSTDSDNTRNFWTVEFDQDNGLNYFFTHYTSDGDRTECTCYNALIIERNRVIHMSLLSDKYARKLCENSGYDNEETLFFLEFSKKPTRLYPTPDDNIKLITFERVSSKGFDINLTQLYRIKNTGFYINRTENALVKTDEKYLYTRTGELSAVTEDSLLIALPDKIKEALNTDKNRLKVPRSNELACYESINSDIFFVHFMDGKVYLGFYNLNKFYDLSANNPGFELIP